MASLEFFSTVIKKWTFHPDFLNSLISANLLISWFLWKYDFYFGNSISQKRDTQTEKDEAPRASRIIKNKLIITNRTSRIKTLRCLGNKKAFWKWWDKLIQPSFLHVLVEFCLILLTFVKICSPRCFVYCFIKVDLGFLMISLQWSTWRWKGKKNPESGMLSESQDPLLSNVRSQKNSYLKNQRCACKFFKGLPFFIYSALTSAYVISIQISLKRTWLIVNLFKEMHILEAMEVEK